MKILIVMGMGLVILYIGIYYIYIYVINNRKNEHWADIETEGCT